MSSSKPFLHLVSSQHTTPRRKVSLDGSYRWIRKFAWYPTRVEDVGWMFWQNYQILAEVFWSGGVCGGLVYKPIHKVMFRTSLMLTARKGTRLDGYQL